MCSDLRTVTLIVAAGGRGTRLNLTGQVGSKSLVSLMGQPLLTHALQRLRSPAIQRAFIVSNPSALDRCMMAARIALPDVLLHAVLQEKPQGTLDALIKGIRAFEQASPKVSLNHPLAFLLGDNIPGRDALGQALSILNPDRALFFTRLAQRPTSSSRVVRRPDGAIDLIKVPDQSLPYEVCCGFFVYGPGIWQALAMEDDFHDGQEWNVDSWHRQLCLARKVEFIAARASWHNINTPDDLRHALSVMGAMQTE